MASSSATLGKLPEFDPDNGDFEVYLERLECFIAANDIAEEKKLQVFLTTIGEKAYGTLRSLLLPKTPTKVTFEVAVDALKKHYAPKSSVVTERYRFHQRKQEKHESVADFIVGLKKLAATCAFGTFLEEALRDRLIAGLQADAVRCRLLATPDAELTWERACSIAVAMEAATKDTQQMASTKSEGIAASVSDLHWQGQAKERRPQFDSLVKQLAWLFATSTNSLFERHEFTRRPQLPGESFLDYVTVLKEKAVRFKFGLTYAERVRDQIIHGSSNSPVR
ncbi:uncharacterized protein LOC119405542 [Rhipicephalus sanguineus]|uniref:uncharacterized protein LOC119405542 n=1 Tax=Rhipicephalus sanguineus TaxID=34632 RepID=UPI0020C554AA|nr:uncharacterized protein LOC119405542 [Rhipicephalus sanguineus]